MQLLQQISLFLFAYTSVRGSLLVQVRVWSLLGSFQKNFQLRKSDWCQAALFPFPCLPPHLLFVLPPLLSPPVLLSLVQKFINLNNLL